jgi:3'-5' exoribonuclease
MEMDQPSLIPTKCFVRDLVDGQEVDAIFVVRARNRRQKRNGEAFLKLQLGDATGLVEAVAWDGVDELDPVCKGGAIVRVLGRYSVDERYGAGITIRRMRAAAEGEYQLADLAEAPPVPYRQMAADLQSLVETVQRQHLRQLLDRLIDRDYHEAPAAKYYHQAYRHGLLEHCLSVAQGVSALAATFPGIDRDIAVAGALLHDIGKVETYACRNGAIELTDAGKLLGEIPLGYYRVRRAIEEIEAFPATDADSLLHIILSHHGKLEHGSPVVPCTREATLVHFIDNLGGNLGSFDRIEKALAEGAAWSDFDRGIATAAYFGAREQAA